MSLCASLERGTSRKAKPKERIAARDLARMKTFKK